MSRFDNKGLEEDGWSESGASTEDAPLSDKQTGAKKRLSVGLVHSQHRAVSSWIFQRADDFPSGALNMVDIIRVLLDELLGDEELQGRVLAKIKERTAQGRGRR